MKLPGRRCLLVVATLTVLTGCTNAPTPTPAPWRVVVADAQGAIITDGTTTLGFDRTREQPSWRVDAEATGAACTRGCPNAVVSFGGRRGLTRIDNESQTRLLDEPVYADVRVLGSTGSNVVLARGTARKTELVSWKSGTPRVLRELDAGSRPLWFGNRRFGTAVTSHDVTTSAVTLDFTPRTPKVREVLTTPQPNVCLDPERRLSEQPSRQVRRALTGALKEATACSRTTNGWVLASTYLAVGGDDPTSSRPTTDLAFVGNDRRVRWTRRLTNSPEHRLSPDGTSIAAISGSSLRVLAVDSGCTLTAHRNVIATSYVTPSQLVAVSKTGRLTWLRVPASPSTGSA